MPSRPPPRKRSHDARSVGPRDRTTPPNPSRRLLQARRNQDQYLQPTSLHTHEPEVIHINVLLRNLSLFQDGTLTDLINNLCCVLVFATPSSTCRASISPRCSQIATGHDRLCRRSPRKRPRRLHENPSVPFANKHVARIIHLPPPVEQDAHRCAEQSLQLVFETPSSTRLASISPTRLHT